MDFINAERTQFPGIAAELEEMGTLFQEKLWHQLTSKLMDAVNNPAFAGRLVGLYNNFVEKFCLKLNPLDVASFAIAASRQCADSQASVAFLTPVLEALKNDKEGRLMLKLAFALIHIRGKKAEDAKKALEDCQQEVDSADGVLDARVMSLFYRAQMEHYKTQGTAAQFYETALLFLAYTDLDGVPQDEQVRLASDVGLSALLGDNVYNFGELLRNPVLKVLKGTQHEWLGKLLQAFNAGDIGAFHSMEEKGPHQEVIQKNAQFLNQKIRIMALMEMVFKRPSDNRSITFEEISKACRLKLGEVEMLLMKAFSLKVIKGKMDEVEQVVRINWVQPRVLNEPQIEGLRDRLKDWSRKVQQTAHFLEDNAPEILSQRAY